MDLREWVASEHDSLRTRFEQSVGAHVPYEFWRDGRGGSSIAWLVFHTTLHADLAVNAVLRGEPTVIDRARRGRFRTGLPLAVLAASSVICATCWFQSSSSSRTLSWCAPARFLDSARSVATS